jgi:hypothetical protein
MISNLFEAHGARSEMMSRTGSCRYVGVAFILFIAIFYIIRPVYLYLAYNGVEQEQAKCYAGAPGDTRHEDRPSESGFVRVIQLTDAGEYVSRCQASSAFYDINWDRPKLSPRDFNVDVRQDAVSLPKFVVLYIHGWHNNAREDTGDLPIFRKVMRKLAAANTDKQVTGIYVSWEADSRIPIWRYLNFWDRMGAADRIAASGKVTSIIGAISAMVGKAPKGGQFITIGHSFGARILLESSLQSTITAVERAHPGAPNAFFKLVDGPAQTTILLNPAIEASHFTTLAAVERPYEHFLPTQKPVVLEVSTDNDRATGIAFPLGQWLSLWTRRKELNTLGNYPQYQTHELVTQEGGTCTTASAPEGGLTESFRAGQLCLRRTKGSPNNPFLVVKTSSDIINGHNGIWSEEFRDWLFHYVDELGKQLPSKHVGQGCSVEPTADIPTSPTSANAELIRLAGCQ